jgi:hypothetical protein
MVLPSNINQDAASTSLLLGNPARVPIAPWWHTVSILIVLGIGSAASFHERGLPDLKIPGLSVNLSGYLTVLAEEWLLVLFIWLWLSERDCRWPVSPQTAGGLHGQLCET